MRILFYVPDFLPPPPPDDGRREIDDESRALINRMKQQALVQGLRLTDYAVNGHGRYAVHLILHHGPDKPYYTSYADRDLVARIALVDPGHRHEETMRRLKHFLSYSTLDMEV